MAFTGYSCLDFARKDRTQKREPELRAKMFPESLTFPLSSGSTLQFVIGYINRVNKSTRRHKSPEYLTSFSPSMNNVITGNDRESTLLVSMYKAS